MFHSAHNRLALRIVATLALGGLRLPPAATKGPLYLPPPEPRPARAHGGRQTPPPPSPCSVPAMTAVSVQPDLAGSPRYQNGVLHAERAARQPGRPAGCAAVRLFRAALRSAWETYRDAIGEPGAWCASA